MLLHLPGKFLNSWQHKASRTNSSDIVSSGPGHPSSSLASSVQQHQETLESDTELHAGSRITLCCSFSSFTPQLPSCLQATERCQGDGAKMCKVPQGWLFHKSCLCFFVCGWVCRKYSNDGDSRTRRDYMECASSSTSTTQTHNVPSVLGCAKYGSEVISRRKYGKLLWKLVITVI